MKLNLVSKGPSFDQKLNELIALRKEYNDLPEVLETYLSDFKDENQIIESTPVIQKTGGIGIHKIRIKRKGSGSSGGYRLYFLSFYPQKTICLLTIYPKNGKLGMSNLPKEELKALIREYAIWNKTKSN